MKDNVHAHARPTAEVSSGIRIDYPPSGTTLPAAFTVTGTLGEDEFARECYFECKGNRTDADAMHSAHGKWSADFSKLPPCDGYGVLTAVGENTNGSLSKDCHDKLSVNPDVPEHPRHGPERFIKLGSPPSGAHLPKSPATFPAKGSLEGTTVKELYFLCDDGTKTPASDPINQGTTAWSATFSVPACTKGTLTVVGNDNSSDSHGNMTVS